MAHFVSSRHPQRGSKSLINIKQREKESIRAYVNRFNIAVLEVRNLDQSIAMAALKGGLQKNDLLFSLKKKYPEILPICWLGPKDMPEQKKPSR